MIPKEKIIELYYNQKLSYRDIAKKLGCSVMPIKCAIEKYKLKPRSKSEACKLRVIKKPHTNPGRKDMPKARLFGKDNPAYKRGYTLLKSGYKMLNINGEQRLEQRYVWEKHNNKLIPEGYQIHHLDWNKLNNKIENLQLIKNSEHQKLHNQQRNSKGQFKNQA